MHSERLEYLESYGASLKQNFKICQESGLPKLRALVSNSRANDIMQFCSNFFNTKTVPSLEEIQIYNEEAAELKSFLGSQNIRLFVLGLEDASVQLSTPGKPKYYNYNVKTLCPNYSSFAARMPFKCEFDFGELIEGFGSCWKIPPNFCEKFYRISVLHFERYDCDKGNKSQVQLALVSFVRKCLNLRKLLLDCSNLDECFFSQLESPTLRKLVLGDFPMVNDYAVLLSKQRNLRIIGLVKQSLLSQDLIRSACENRRNIRFLVFRGPVLDIVIEFYCGDDDADYARVSIAFQDFVFRTNKIKREELWDKIKNLQELKQLFI